MDEIKVKDIMSRDLITVGPDTSVKEVAKIMAEKKIGALPVVDNKGELLGIVTEKDLIMQDVKLHFPTYIHLLDGYIYLGSLKKFEEEFKKAVGAKASDVMSPDPVVINSDATLEDAATLMVEKDVGRLLVLEEGRLCGIVSRGDIVRAISRS